jgi:modulator of FtsH protease HflK
MSRASLVAAGLALALAGWAATGLYVVDPGQAAVVFRFGAVDRQAGPGVHLRAPWPVESHEAVLVGEVRREQTRRLRMLTGDTNLVDLELVAQYTVQDPAALLLASQAPSALVVAAVASVATGAVADMDVDKLLTIGRTQLQTDVKRDAQALLDGLGAGVRLDAIEVAHLSPPPAVVDAFNDVSSARGDRETLALAAEAYASDLLPLTRGAQAERVQSARAQAADRSAQADADAARFRAVRAQARLAPAATRARLRREAWQGIEADVVQLSPGARLAWPPPSEPAP